MSQREPRQPPRPADGPGTATALLEVSGVQWATSKNLSLIHI